MNLPLAMLKIANLLRRVPPDVIPLVVEIIERVSGSKDPLDMAKRAVEETARVRAFDEIMRRAKPK